MAKLGSLSEFARAARLGAVLLALGLAQGQVIAGPPVIQVPLSAAQLAACAEVPDQAGLPRVLLLGDSISLGYTLQVRADLAGVANVHRPPENCGATATGLLRLPVWLGAGHWDVIHFNFGLHDLKYVDAAGNMVPVSQGTQLASLADYETNLRTLVNELRRTGAKLVFATSTPVPAGTLGRVAGDEARYNAVAVRVMRESGVAVDDLAAFAQPKLARIQQAQNVHFTPEGYAELARVVAASIRKTLTR